MSSTLAALPVAAKVPELQQARAGAAKEDIFLEEKQGVKRLCMQPEIWKW